MPPKGKSNLEKLTKKQLLNRLKKAENEKPKSKQKDKSETPAKNKKKGKKKKAGYNPSKEPRQPKKGDLKDIDRFDKQMTAHLRWKREKERKAELASKRYQQVKSKYSGGAKFGKLAKKGFRKAEQQLKGILF